MQKVIRNVNSTSFGLAVQDAILQGYRVTKTFSKPSVGYYAILEDDIDKALNTPEQKIEYKQTLLISDSNSLQFALKLQQVILKGYRIKPSTRFGKLGVMWQASVEIGKGQLEEIVASKSTKVGNLEFKSFGDASEIKGVENSLSELDGVSVGGSETKEATVGTKQTPKKRTTKQTVNKEQ